MQTSDQRDAKVYAHPKYRRQTRSFIFWMILSFVSTIACSVMLGKALHSRDLLDMTGLGWMLIPKEGSDPTEALIRGECAPGDASCGTWSRIGKLNFSKNPAAVKARRLFLVAEHDFGSVLAAREGKETLVKG